MARNVLITGGSSGIGEAAVRRFARSGDTVWLTYHRGAARAQQIVQDLAGCNVAAFALDLSDRAACLALPDALPGSIDVLVANAALGTKTVQQQARDVHDQDALLMQVNVLGTLWLTQVVLRSMRARATGKIVIISSVGGGIAAFPGFRHADGMSKAAVAHLGRQLAAETAHEPIDVFTVCPGATDTPMFRASSLDHLTEQQRRELVDRLPGGRMIEPEDIADLVHFLCTSAGRVLRGAVLDASLGLGARPGLLTEG